MKYLTYNTHTKKINKIWHHIKLSVDSDPLQSEANKKLNPTKLQMFHNYFLNWFIVFIKHCPSPISYNLSKRYLFVLFYCRCISSLWCEFDDRERERNISFTNRNFRQCFGAIKLWSEGNFQTHQRIWDTLWTYRRNQERNN